MSKTLLIEGNTQNGSVIDGEGRTLEGNDCLLVRSIQQGEDWLVPENITIKNFNIEGSVRIIGLGINGEGELVRKSSKNKNHTEMLPSRTDDYRLGAKIRPEKVKPLKGTSIKMSAKKSRKYYLKAERSLVVL